MVEKWSVASSSIAVFYLIARQLLWGKNGGFGTALYSSWVLSDITDQWTTLLA